MFWNVIRFLVYGSLRAMSCLDNESALCVNLLKVCNYKALQGTLKVTQYMGILTLGRDDMGSGVSLGLVQL